MAVAVSLSIQRIRLDFGHLPNLTSAIQHHLLFQILDAEQHSEASNHGLGIVRFQDELHARPVVLYHLLLWSSGRSC